MLVNIDMHGCCFEALAVTSGYEIVAYYLVLLPSLWFSLMQNLMSHAHTQLCTDLLKLREMARGDGSICVCVCVCLSVCLSMSVCMCACLCLCVLAYYMSVILSVCVWVYVSCCICIVHTWMSRCLLSWHGMIYVCTCDIACMSVCSSVCPSSYSVCVYVCLSIVHVARTW